MLGGGSDRLKRINATRVQGNLFAQACVRYGVGSAQCPRDQLTSFAALTKRKYPTAYREIVAPLLATGRSNIGLSGLQQLQLSYLSKRQSAPDFASYAHLIRGSSSGSFRGLRL